MSTKYTPEEITATKKQLKKLLKPGTIVYAVLRHVSASGMTRWIDFYTFKGNERIYLSGYMSIVTDYSRDWRKHEGLKIEGCGMDMGFAVVYNLGRVLYPKGFKLAKNQYGRNGDKSGRDTNGGYALRSAWL